MDCSLPGSSVHGITQARLLEWVAIFFSTASSWPKNQTCISCNAGRFFTTELPGRPLLVMIVLWNYHLHLAYLEKGWEPVIVKGGAWRIPVHQVPRADTGCIDAMGGVSREWLLRPDPSAEPLGCPRKAKLYKTLPLSSSTKQARLLRKSAFFFFFS